MFSEEENISSESVRMQNGVSSKAEEWLQKLYEEREAVLNETSLNFEPEYEEDKILFFIWDDEVLKDMEMQDIEQ